VDKLRSQPENRKLLNVLENRGYTAERMTSSSADIRQMLLKHGGADKKDINRFMQLLSTYPPSLSTEECIKLKKTDPVMKSVEIIRDLEKHKDE